jgi:hypothetical protein
MLAISTPLSYYTPEFDGEQLNAMLNAFVAVCEKLRVRPAASDKLTDVIALKIIDAARAGEYDAHALAVNVLAELNDHVDG